MESPDTALVPSDLEQRRIDRAGGMAAIALGLGYVAIFPLYAKVGAPPVGGEAWFAYLPGKTAIWWWIVALSVLTDLLYLPVTYALYQALKPVGRSAVRLAGSFVALFVVLDLAVTWTHYVSILELFRSYAATTDAARRTAYLAAADYASAMLASPLEIVYSIVTLSLGILVTSLVMRKSGFSRLTAYAGLATGLSGVAALTGWGIAIIGNALLATVWLFLVGARLVRRGRA